MGHIHLEVVWDLPLILAGVNNDMTSSLKVDLNSLAEIVKIARITLDFLLLYLD